jgi:hypothetical protein
MTNVLNSVVVFRLIVATGVILVTSASIAQVEMPPKGEWRMHDGSLVRGKAYGFGRQLCFLQRRGGKILLNGQKVDDPTSSELLKKLCAEQGIPLDEPKKLQEILSKQPFAQVVMPYFTLKYHNDSGGDAEIAIALLAPDEIQELRPVFEVWLKEKQREHEEQMRQAMELRNQRAMIAMQREALRAQQDMAAAAKKSAEANKKAADELERIRRESR